MRCDGTCDSVPSLKAKLAEVQEKNTELEHLFDVQHSRTVVADRMWQLHHGKPHVRPDLGELIEWLMSQSLGFVQERDAARDEVVALRERVEAACAELEGPGFVSPSLNQTWVAGVAEAVRIVREALEGK